MADPLPPEQTYTGAQQPALEEEQKMNEVSRFCYD